MHVAYLGTRGADLESPPIKVVGEMARLFMDKVFTSGCKI